MEEAVAVIPRRGSWADPLSRHTCGLPESMTDVTVVSSLFCYQCPGIFFQPFTTCWGSNRDCDFVQGPWKSRSY